VRALRGWWRRAEGGRKGGVDLAKIGRGAPVVAGTFVGLDGTSPDEGEGPSHLERERAKGAGFDKRQTKKK